MSVEENYLPLPKNLYVETTNKCNLRCKGCIQYRGNWELERDISLEELIMITDQLPDLERAALHGIGEPLMNKALPKMIRHLKKQDVFVMLNSNGILLDEKMEHDLINAGLDELRISLDAASAEGYRKMRSSDSFDSILANLKHFENTLKVRRKNRPKISLWFLGTTENIAELPEFIKIAADIRVAEVYLQRLVYFQDDDGYGLAKQDSSLVDSDKGAIELIQKSHNLAKELGVEFNASGLCAPADSLKGKSRSLAPWRKCYRPVTLMYITANGHVLPCCISPFSTTYYSSIILGNVFATPLEEIWNGLKYTNFRKQRQTDTPPVCCQGCGIFWSL
jgi:radical SAM protein with 4Fe4S-binding SPASM domain